MTKIVITENLQNKDNLFYIQNALSELFKSSDCNLSLTGNEDRVALTIQTPDYYSDIIYAEIIDKTAEIIVVKYKYEYFKKNLKVAGLTQNELQILYASLISADLNDDKKYTFDRLKGFYNIAIDGFFNFRLLPLKKKWQGVVSYMPPCFVSSQLKDFVGYLLENKNKRVYIENGRVYDSHYRRLLKSSLMGESNVPLTLEVILSNCGIVQISSDTIIDKEDENFIKEFYGDKICFSNTIYNKY